MSFLSEKMHQLVIRFHPARIIALGYLSYVILGWILLSTSWAQTSKEELPLIDTLFTATSAVSTTGLSTLSTGDDFTFFGQVIILLLIQLGGIGYMTVTSLICLVGSNNLTPAQKKISKTVFSIPKTLKIESFIKCVFIFTVIIEGAGACALYFPFKEAGFENPLWSAIFHSISAFCTAGFGLLNSSMETFKDNIAVNLVLGVLSYSGAIGFIVFVDMWNYFTGKTRRVTLTSRIILAATFWVTVIPTLLIFVQEPSISAYPPAQRLMAALFQVMSASTTVGFNSISIGACSSATLLLLIVVMIIGASPAGTGGGIKTTTISALYGTLKSYLTRKEKIVFWNKEIPETRVRSAVSIFFFYIVVLFCGCYLLTLTESSSFVALLFECASALGTVGLSTGITADLTSLGKTIVIFMMFIGRMSPIALGLILFYQNKVVSEQEDIIL